MINHRLTNIYARRCSRDNQRLVREAFRANSIGVHYSLPSMSIIMVCGLSTRMVSLGKAHVLIGQITQLC
jgi:hypothetical protein